LANGGNPPSPAGCANGKEPPTGQVGGSFYLETGCVVVRVRRKAVCFASGVEADADGVCVEHGENACVIVLSVQELSWWDRLLGRS